jgi:hypothetical protein
MERISNAWHLSKASWQVLAKDRELIAVPVIAGIAALLAWAALLIPGLVLLGGVDGGGADGSVNIAFWLVMLVAAVVSTWIFTLGQASIVAGAAERMEGGDPDISSAFAVARSRAVSLLGWAVLATVVSIVLDQLEQRFGFLGKLVSWAAGVAFAVMSFLALPVIVFENVGPIEAFKRSSALLKRTWGEQVSFNIGIGLLGLIAAAPGLLVGGVLASSGVFPLQVIGVTAGFAWILLVAAITSALSAVFKAALYRYANKLPVDPAFDERLFNQAFRPRR